MNLFQRGVNPLIFYFLNFHIKNMKIISYEKRVISNIYKIKENKFKNN